MGALGAGPLSRAEAAYIVEGMEAGVRNDGRAPLQFREVVLEAGVVQQASGSARCRLGATEVLVAVKVDVGVPFEETPELGGLEVTVDVSPCAAAGPSAETAALEAGRALARSLRWEESGAGCAIDLGALKIVPGKRCWVLTVAGLVLGADGSLLDALSIATKAALADTRIPHIEVSMGEDGGDPELDLDDDPTKAAALDTRRVPVVVSVAQAGRAFAVDLTGEEEAACGGSAVAVAVSAKGGVAGVGKRGGAALQPEALLAMVEAAQRAGAQVHRCIDICLEGARRAAQ